MGREKIRRVRKDGGKEAGIREKVEMKKSRNGKEGRERKRGEEE